jgi:hypothetical protein
MKFPFTRDQFFDIFEKYNATIFPMQIVLFLAGCLMFFLVFAKNKNLSKFTGYVIGCIWLWTGIAYHILFFTEINKGAYIFGGMFIIQGILFIISTFQNKLLFDFINTPTKIISCFFILFGLVIYPIISYMLEKSVVHIISFGLPCPTTIFTLGLLGLQSDSIKKRFLIIPFIWSFIGLYAAVSMGVYQDAAMPIAALYTIIISVKGRSTDDTSRNRYS